MKFLFFYVFCSKFLFVLSSKFSGQDEKVVKRLFSPLKKVKKVILPPVQQKSVWWLFV